VLVSGIENNGARVYVCKKRPSVPGACGSVNIRIDKLDSKVNAEVVAFLNNKQRAQALLDTHRLNTPELAEIDARYAELEDDKLALERAAFRPPQGVKRLPTERYWELRAEIEREQAQLSRRRVVNRDAQPLKDALNRAWSLEAWGAEPMEYRRAIVRIVVERIEVSPVAQRGSEKGHFGAVHNPERIVVTFADEC
jgi:hypothetical protein